MMMPLDPDRSGGCVMPPTRHLRRLAAGVAAAALAAVAACTHESTAPVSPGSTNPALSVPEANLLGEAVAADAQSELDGATLSSGMFLPGLGAPITPFGRSEERRVGKSVDVGGRRSMKKKEQETCESMIKIDTEYQGK